MQAIVHGACGTVCICVALGATFLCCFLILHGLVKYFSPHLPLCRSCVALPPQTQRPDSWQAIFFSLAPALHCNSGPNAPWMDSRTHCELVAAVAAVQQTKLAGGSHTLHPSAGQARMSGDPARVENPLPRIGNVLDSIPCGHSTYMMCYVAMMP
jgi:hypothetical protein